MALGLRIVLLIQAHGDRGVYRNALSILARDPWLSLRFRQEYGRLTGEIVEMGFFLLPGLTVLIHFTAVSERKRRDRRVEQPASPAGG
jgi:hypothetical protein